MAEKDKFPKRLMEQAGLLPISKPELEACPKCAGERTEARMFEAVLRLSVWSNKRSALKAVVWTSCGYTEMYAITPLNLVVKRPDKKLE